MGKKQVNLHLSHYMLWAAMLHFPEDEFLVLEDDCKFNDDWKQKYDDARSVLPDDWGILYLGSCCAYDKPQYCVGKNLYAVKFPLCTHSYSVRKKALPMMLEKCMKVYAPVDIALALDVCPFVPTYTIIPRIADQYDTMLPP